MTRISSMTLAAVIALGGATVASAQYSSQAQDQSTAAQPAPITTAPATPAPATTTAPAATAPAQSAATPPTPAPVVVETKVDLRSGGPQSPESAADARKEAMGALAEARAACRQEGSKQARSDCIRQAQDDAHSLMGSSGGTQRAPREDRR